MADAPTLSDWVRTNGAWLLPLAWTFSALAFASATAAFAPETRTPGAGENFAARLLRWNRRPAVFALLALVAVLLHRFPTIVGPTMQNPDEGQFVAGAITLRYHPIYWKSVDGITTGPLNIIVLTWSWLFGVVPSLATARLTGVLLMFGGMWFGGRALRRFTDEGTARLGVLPGLAWLAFVSFWDLAQYTSEQMSIFLLGHAAWRLARAVQTDTTGDRADLRRWVVAGVSLALLALAKLQSAPAAAALVGVALVARWQTHPRPTPFVQSLLGLLAGGAVVAAALGVYLWIWGLGAQFQFSYLESNLDYAGGARMALPDLLRRMLHAAGDISGLKEFLGTGVIAALVALPLAFSRLATPVTRALLLGAIAFWFGSACSVLGPGRDFGHYLQFITLPTALLGGAALAVLVTAASRCGSVWLRTVAPVVAFTLAALAPQVLRMNRYPSWYRYVMPAQQWEDPALAGRAIAALTRPGEPIAVWGWMPNLYVEAQRPQGVRDANTERQTSGNPLQGAYRVRYLTDLRRNRPAAFIDATGGNNFIFNDQLVHWAKHELWPELHAFVEENYVLVREVAASRIYLRRDLADRATALPANAASSK